MLLCSIIDELEPETKLAKPAKPDANSLLAYFFCQATVAKLSNAQAANMSGSFLMVRDEIVSLAHQSAKD